jgi:hypothetical protein
LWLVTRSDSCQLFIENEPRRLPESVKLLIKSAMANARKLRLEQAATTHSHVPIDTTSAKKEIEPKDSTLEPLNTPTTWCRRSRY